MVRRTDEAEVAVVLKESDDGAVAGLGPVQGRGGRRPRLRWRSAAAVTRSAAGFTAGGSAAEVVAALREQLLARRAAAAGSREHVPGDGGRAVTAASGLIIVDKPCGLTSHDVVARIRGLAGTRRVGHAGTLDPMATGVLVVGVEKATRLLGHLALTEKEYGATIRLGQATDTDDAEGQVVARPPAAALAAPR